MIEWQIEHRVHKNIQAAETDMGPGKMTWPFSLTSQRCKLQPPCYMGILLCLKIIYLWLKTTGDSEILPAFKLRHCALTATKLTVDAKLIYDAIRFSEQVRNGVLTFVIKNPSRDWKAVKIVGFQEKIKPEVWSFISCKSKLCTTRCSENNQGLWRCWREILRIFSWKRIIEEWARHTLASAIKDFSIWKPAQFWNWLTVVQPKILLSHDGQVSFR